MRDNENNNYHSYRGELFSRKLRNKTGLTYFLNLKENREGSLYLNIVESRRKEGGKNQLNGFQRHSLLVFIEQREAFAEACLAALKALEQGQTFFQEIETPQRNFTLKTQKQRQETVLVIREENLHLGQDHYDQIFVLQSSASYFSEVLIETLEFWLQTESQAKKQQLKKPRLLVRSHKT